MSPTPVIDRIEALERFCTAARGYLPDADLAAARALVARTDERLRLSRTHTVVALAGSTGTGKSSIFNGLAGVSLSRTGLRRPTTGESHACVWGGENADRLLDWLGIRRRFQRPGGDLDGLVLVDLPDFDSVEAAHRREADRLLSVVDLIVWVLNPQKYADRIVHKNYLAQFHRHRDITVVVLNQVDLLSQADLNECLIDLRDLLSRGGLGQVPVITASTVDAPGLEGLIDALGNAVAAREAALARLAADLDTVTESLMPLVGTESKVSTVDKATRARLVDALARAAGAPTVAEATRRAYIHRARKMTGWPPWRWVRRFRADPLARLHLGRRTGSGLVEATSLGPAAPAARAAVSLALRDVAERAAEKFPPAWQEAMLGAARSTVDELPDALDKAVASTDLGLDRPRGWWRLVGLLQWMAVAIAAGGLLWLAVRYLMFAFALPEPPMPALGRVPLPTALLLGGLLLGLILSILVRPFVTWGAGRARRRAERRLWSNVERVTDSLVLAPMQGVMAAHATAGQALEAVLGRRREPG